MGLFSHLLFSCLVATLLWTSHHVSPCMVAKCYNMSTVVGPRGLYMYVHIQSMESKNLSMSSTVGAMLFCGSRPCFVRIVGSCKYRERKTYNTCLLIFTAAELLVDVDIIKRMGRSKFPWDGRSSKDHVGVCNLWRLARTISEDDGRWSCRSWWKMQRRKKWRLVSPCMGCS